MNITKNTFENYIPSFRAAAPYIFDNLTAYISEAKSYVEQLCGRDPAEIATATEQATALVCYRAAHRAVPGMDLILTENGFGVVSSQNVAPASRARTDALAESLRMLESQAEDNLVFALLRTEWRETPQAVARMQSLLWCPTLLRRHGIAIDGREAYTEEFLKLKPRIEQAEENVRAIIGTELWSSLVERQRTQPIVEEVAYVILTERARQFMAVAVTSTDPKRLVAQKMRLVDVLHRYESSLPEYTNSSTYRAEHSSNYENKPTDKTYFFE